MPAPYLRTTDRPTDGRPVIGHRTTSSTVNRPTVTLTSTSWGKRGHSFTLPRCTYNLYKTPFFPVVFLKFVQLFFVCVFCVSHHVLRFTCTISCCSRLMNKDLLTYLLKLPAQQWILLILTSSPSPFVLAMHPAPCFACTPAIKKEKMKKRKKTALDIHPVTLSQSHENGRQQSH